MDNDSAKAIGTQDDPALKALQKMFDFFLNHAVRDLECPHLVNKREDDGHIIGCHLLENEAKGGL